MSLVSTALLLPAAAVVALLHAVLPDHWLPLAVVGRTQRWGPLRTVRVSVLAATGHVLVSLVLAGLVSVIGLHFRAAVDREQGHLVGGLLILTGIGFLVWSLTGHGHSHEHEHNLVHDDHHPAHGDPHDSHGGHHHHGGSAARLAAIVLPFGIAASPDLTILPVALAAAAAGTATVIGVLAVFAAVTVAVFVGLTLAGTLIGYQIRGEWLERHASTVTALVLIAIGAVVFAGL